MCLFLNDIDKVTEFVFSFFFGREEVVKRRRVHWRENNEIYRNEK